MAGSNIDRWISCENMIATGSINSMRIIVTRKEILHPGNPPYRLDIIHTERSLYSSLRHSLQRKRCCGESWWDHWMIWIVVTYICSVVWFVKPCIGCRCLGCIRCYNCLGRGFKRCISCHGSGRLWKSDPHGHRHVDTCWRCHGTGRKRLLIRNRVETTPFLLLCICFKWTSF